MKKIINYIKYHFGNALIMLKTLYFSKIAPKHKGRWLFVLGTAEHPNYGDFAISQAQYQFLLDKFDDKIIEFNEEEMSNPLTFGLIDALLKKDDIIFCQGGGNHGNVYTFHEGYRRNIIKHFKNNKIVLFPQTYYFTDDENGKREAEISKEIYNSHPDLVLAFRDKLSYNLASSVYTAAKVVFCPDMVLYYLDKFTAKPKDNSVMLLFRAGVEAKFSAEDKKALAENLKKKYTVKYNDHAATDKINAKTRYSVMKKQIELYSESSVVITEKLHGAIFTMLTGTPCIMLETFNHKIREFYKIFEGCKGYYFAQNIDEIPDMVEEAISIKKVKNPDSSEYYDNFFKAITE